MTELAAPPVAETAADIDAAWLTQALRISKALGNEKVVSVQYDPIGTGQVANCARLTVEYDSPTAAPATLVAKTGNTNPDLREKIKKHGAYEREVGFYRELANGLDVPTPQCYYSDLDVDAGTFVLLLEDLSPAVQGDQIAGCSLDVARVAVRGLVGLHAPRWCDPGLREIGWFHRKPDADRAMRMETMPLLWAGFQQRYSDLITDTIKEAGDQFIANLRGFLYSDRNTWAVTHGDYRLDNMLIRDTGAGAPQIHVVDWQTTKDGPAMEDVAYFLGAGLPSELRREHEEELVRDYHDRLVAAGVSRFSFDQCWADYRWGTWSGLMMAIYAGMIVERTERGDLMFVTMAERHSRHALDLNAQEVIRG